MGREVLLDRLLAQQTGYPKERRHPLRVADVGVLHGADAGMLVGIDYERAADPERARWALLSIYRAHQQNQNSARRTAAAHDLVLKPRLGLGSHASIYRDLATSSRQKSHKCAVNVFSRSRLDASFVHAIWRGCARRPN